MKNFNQASWNCYLARKNWEILAEMTNVDEMAIEFSKLVNSALDEIAPVKSFISKPGYKAGITTETKMLMTKRDKARKAIGSSPGDKWIAIQKYKTLRNRVTTQVRNDVKKENGRRIEEASNESEYWNVVNDINKPHSETIWKLEDEDKTVITDEETIASKFNEFFVNKIELLK